MVAFLLILILALLLGGPLLMLGVASFAVTLVGISVVVILAIAYIAVMVISTRHQNAVIAKESVPEWKRNMRESGQENREQELWDKLAERLQVRP